MRSFAFATTLLVLVLTTSATSVENNSVDLPVVHGYKLGDKCPAKIFYNDCNRCVCGLNGHSAVCTLTACQELEELNARQVLPVYPHIDYFAETGQCVAGEFFYDLCNLCQCSPDGESAACTSMACRPVEKPHIDGYTVGRKCPAGKTFYDDCNTCVCSEDGVSADCTLMECAPKPQTRRALHNYPHIDNFEQVQQCTPGQMFYDNCNTCRCGSDGKSAACTLKGCPPVDKPRIDGYLPGKKCPAGKTFYDKCNACRCNAKGNSATCTMMAC